MAGRGGRARYLGTAMQEWRRRFVESGVELCVTGSLVIMLLVGLDGAVLGSTRDISRAPLIYASGFAIRFLIIYLSAA